jgi:ribonuclease J
MPAAAGGQTLRIVPLGGLGEIGMNCLALQQQDDIVLIDCGITFPSTDLGVDIFHPRFDFVHDRKEHIRGVVLTHGHEDHIGALPYLLDAVDVPVWGPPHALELSRYRLAEHGFSQARLRLRPMATGSTYEVGSFTFEPIRVTHSIADATALAIRTVAGLVVHTGDFKLDPTPPDGELTDEARLQALGDEGVRLLLSDSTNVDSPGTSASELTVGQALGEIVGRASGRVVIGMFASNTLRLRMIAEAAIRHKRSICLLGRSMKTHVRAAQASGRISWPSDLLVHPDVAVSMPRDRVLFVASGTQAEKQSGLTRLSLGTHPVLQLSRGDMVVMSSRVIPGNDRAVYDLFAGFLRTGVELVTWATDRRVHASGHAHRDEQTRMIALTRPAAFLPVHGTLHHLTRHAALARQAAVPDVLVAENGDVVEIGTQSPLTRTARVTVGRVAVAEGEEISERILEERAQVGRTGFVVVSLVVDRQGTIAAPPRMASRGVLEEFTTEIVQKASRAIARAIADSGSRVRSNDDELAEVARLSARRLIEAETGMRPLVLVTVTRV